jgi:hypothetical protein
MSKCTMQCVLPERNIRVFAAGLACLAKVGKEVTLTASRSGRVRLQLMATSDAQTAAVTVSFGSGFFESFLMDSGVPLYAKMSLKSWVAALRSHRSTERLTVNLVQDGARHLVVLSSQCKGGLVKTHELHYEDGALFQPEYDAAAAAKVHRFCAGRELLARAFGLLHGAEEATLTVIAGEQRSLCLRSHVTKAEEQLEYSLLKTCVTIDASDLDSFHAPPPLAAADFAHLPPTQADKAAVEANALGTQIAFGLREPRAFLAFCEAADAARLELIFNEPGMPFRLSADVGAPRAEDGNDSVAEHDVVFRVELLMATLVSEEIPVNDEGETSQRDQPQQPPPQGKPRRDEGEGDKRAPRRRASSDSSDEDEYKAKVQSGSRHSRGSRGARDDEDAHEEEKGEDDDDDDDASVGAMGRGGHKGSLGARRANKRVRGYGSGDDAR